MIRKLTNAKKQRRKEANHKAVMPIYERGGQLIPADYLTCHQNGEQIKSPVVGHAISGRPASFVRLRSDHAGLYNGKGGFTIRGVNYQRLGDGSLRALTKPRSRVKRLREERMEAKQTA